MEERQLKRWEYERRLSLAFELDAQEAHDVYLIIAEISSRSHGIYELSEYQAFDYVMACSRIPKSLEDSLELLRKICLPTWWERHRYGWGLPFEIVFEFNWRDMWIGIFPSERNGLYICIIPCFPIHIRRL